MSEGREGKEWVEDTRLELDVAARFGTGKSEWVKPLLAPEQGSGRVTAALDRMTPLAI